MHIVEQLIELHTTLFDDDDEQTKTTIDDALGQVIQGVGIEIFWPWIEWSTKKSDGSVIGIDKNRAWVLSLMKTSSSASQGQRNITHLEFFITKILNKARECDFLIAKKSKNNEMKVYYKKCVIYLWSLFTSFCSNYPCDITKQNEVVYKFLSQTICKAIGDTRYHPHLITIICNSIKILSTNILESTTNNGFISDNMEEEEMYKNNTARHGGGEEDDDKVNKEEGVNGSLSYNDSISDIKEVMKQVSTKLLPESFKLVGQLYNNTTSSNIMDVDETADNNKKVDNHHEIQVITGTISILVKLAPITFVQDKLFKEIIQRLVKTTVTLSSKVGNDEDNDDDDDAILQLENKICSLLNLSQAIVTSKVITDNDSIGLLYKSIKPLIRTDEFSVVTSRIQKRSYSVLKEICYKYPSFFISNRGEGESVDDNHQHLDEIIDLLVGSIMTCQISSRHMRLKCMTSLIDNGFNNSTQQHMDAIPKIVSEVLLCLKDSNGKTREAAYQLLLSMATVKQQHDAEDGMTDYFKIIVAALGGQTSTMRSAAVMASSRLVFEYARNDMTVQALLPSLLQTILVLFDENSREVIKSVVGFVIVSVAAMTPEQFLV